MVGRLNLTPTGVEHEHVYDKGNYNVLIIRFESDIIISSFLFFGNMRPESKNKSIVWNYFKKVNKTAFRW